MKTITAKEVQELIGKGEVIIIDVRTPAEYDAGHIHSAQNINIGSPSFTEKIKELDKNAEYIVNCERGGRSGRAVALMDELGFSKAQNLGGGILAWEKEGLPIEK